MNITLYTMLFAPSHDLSYEPAKEAMRMRAGDIQTVHRRVKVTEPPSPDRPLCFIHITNVPNTLSFRRIKRRLESGVFNPVIANNAETWRVRKWRVHFNLLSAVQFQTLKDTRELTITWDQLQQLTRRKIVHNKLDRSQDDTTNLLNQTELE